MSFAGIRKYLLILFCFSSLGMLVELALLGHYEDSWQLVPIVLLSLAFMVGCMRVLNVDRVSNGLFKLLAVFLICSGAIGMVLHFRGNQAFELEMYPGLSGWQLFWKTITGATPTLSPAAMILIGLIGWLFSRIPPTDRNQ